ncbi:MAG: hypothetical protein K6G06_07560, partial [Butyrivibrio sp.]|nr:hypothetical protein [Butyrivibrio sp.]
MHKSIARKLAGVLAAVVLTTTFASDYNSIGARASEIEATETLASEEEAEVVETSETAEEGSFVEEDETEEVAETLEETEEATEEQPEEVVDEVTEETTEEVAEEPATEETTEVTEDQTPSEEVTGEAGEETPAEETADPEAAPAEVAPAENAEVKNITYVAGEGGSVSIESEQVVEVAEGATAIADEGFRFVNWTGSDESILSESETFVPSGDVLVDGAVFTANFAKIIEKEFSASETIDGIKIDLYADPGVLPADAKLEVTKVSQKVEEEIKDVIDEKTEADVEVKQTFSYDINIKSGEEYIQPKAGTVDVRFSQIEEAKSEDTSLAVYHVEDDLSDATEVAKEEESTDGVIEFDAEHFSIYTVTIYGYYEDAPDVTMTFNAGVYKLDGTPIDKKNNIRKVRFEDIEKDTYYYTTTPAKVAPVMDGYTFDHATFDDKNIKAFYYGTYDAPKNKAYLLAKVAGEEDVVEIPTDTEDEVVKFYYKTAKKSTYSTSDHIDLGFTDKEMPAVANVYIKINNLPKFEMGDGVEESDLGVLEKRLQLPFDYNHRYSYGNLYWDTLKAVDVTDTFVFEVVLKNGKSYTHKTTVEENKNAYERCRNAHDYRQYDYGFDYKFDFVKDFGYKATVTYHSNFGEDKTYAADEKWTTPTQGGKSKHTVHSYADTKLPENTGSEFKGWGVKNQKGEVVLTYKFKNNKFNPASFEIKDKDTVDLYAVWEAKLAPYTVKYVKEGDPKIELKPADTSRKGKVGVSVSATEEDKKSFEAKDGTTYEYAGKKDATVTPDGKAVVLVYF